MTSAANCPHGCGTALNCLGLDQGGSLPAGCPYNLPADAIPNRAACEVCGSTEAIKPWGWDNTPLCPNHWREAWERQNAAANATRNRVPYSERYDHPYYGNPDQMDAYDAGWRDAMRQEHPPEAT